MEIPVAFFSLPIFEFAFVVIEFDTTGILHTAHNVDNVIFTHNHLGGSFTGTRAENGISLLQGTEGLSKCLNFKYVKA